MSVKLRTELMELFLNSPMSELPPTLHVELLEVSKKVGMSGGVFTDVCELWMQDLSDVELESYITAMKEGRYKC